ncbi:MAG: hypothetical protein HPY83_13325 [Anaerolineae bacterium]|nr:hypothetical protein [Anaerolineae bacterium]
MAADSYALSGDLALAKARLSSWDQEEAGRMLERLRQAAADSGSMVQAMRLEQLAADLELVAAAGGQKTTEPAPAEGPQARATGAGSDASSLLLVAGVVLAGGGLLAAGYAVFRRAGVGTVTSALSALRARAARVPRPRFGPSPRVTTDSAPARREVGPPTQPGAEAAVARPEGPDQEEDEISLDEALTLLAQEIEIEDHEEPAPDRAETLPQLGRERETAHDANVIGTYMATYRHGCDEMFDTSFNLEADDGEFLGECGVGVAETVGDSSPERACAMEIWLFDKGDIRTTTKLLVSDFALDDPDIRDTLAGRGEIVRASRGQSLRLETAGLELRTEVIDVRYGDEPDAPPHSYFQELTLELRVTRRD